MRAVPALGKIALMGIGSSVGPWIDFWMSRLVGKLVFSSISVRGVGSASFRAVAVATFDTSDSSFFVS